LHALKGGENIRASTAKKKQKKKKKVNKIEKGRSRLCREKGRGGEGGEGDADRKKEGLEGNGEENSGGEIVHYSRVVVKKAEMQAHWFSGNENGKRGTTLEKQRKEKISITGKKTGNSIEFNRIFKTRPGPVPSLHKGGGGGGGETGVSQDV